jgi:3',5'-cyclic-AMP phosphodiesterase
MTQSPLLIAQITDSHLFADESQTLLGIPTARSLQAVLSQLIALEPQPDLLLITGDLSQDETPESYQQLQQLVAPLNLPTYWVRGNHDQLPDIEQFLNHPPLSAQKQFQQGGWNFLLLNSAVLGKVYGQLSPETLNWLEQQLQAQPDLPTLIALHHPPVPIESNWMDDISLHHADELMAVLDRHPQVKLVLFGHIHQAFAAERRGIHYLGAPSTCVQFKPKHQEFAVDQEKPGFRLIWLYPDGRFNSRVERVALSYPLDLTASGY